MRAKPSLILLSSAALLLAASIASAQPAPPAGGGGDRSQRFQQMREHGMSDLKALLQIRPDQETAFSAFQTAMQPPARSQRMERPSADLTTPQLLDLQDKRMAEMKARMDSRRSAILTFYAALSPTQQKAFDTVARQHGMMHGGMMMRGGRQGWGGRGMDGHRMGGHWGGRDKDGPGDPPDGPPPPPPPGAG
jgi:hypothetical protein